MMIMINYDLICENHNYHDNPRSFLTPPKAVLHWENGSLSYIILSAKIIIIMKIRVPYFRLIQLQY